MFKGSIFLSLPLGLSLRFSAVRSSTRDMLLSVTGPASDAIRAVFLRTRDDLLVLGCLRGFRSHARACVYLGLLAPFDAALVFFFRRGLEYASAAAAGAAGPPLPGEIDGQNGCAWEGGGAGEQTWISSATMYYICVVNAAVVSLQVPIVRYLFTMVKYVGRTG